MSKYKIGDVVEYNSEIFNGIGVVIEIDYKDIAPIGVNFRKETLFTYKYEGFENVWFCLEEDLNFLKN